MIDTIIIDWVVRGILIIYCVITTVVAVIKARKKNKATTQQADVDENNFFVIALAALKEIKSVEELYKQITKEGAKTGKLKKENVITVLERICNSMDFKFNLTRWEEFIDAVIDVKNSGELEKLSNKLDEAANSGNQVIFEVLGGNK